MPLPSSSPLEPILVHAGWLHGLARSLVADPHAADDLVQDAWRAALEGPPPPDAPVRRWLGGVVRNLRREAARGRSRRVAREANAARPEGTLAAGEIVERLDLQQLLLSAIRDLDEPCRTTIYERFYEDLPPREIARRHGVPVKTVKTRLSRGLERLRANLDRRHGGRREAWLPALLPLAGWPALPAPTVGMIFVNTKLKVAVVALALLGTSAVVWNVVRPEAPGPVEIARSIESRPPPPPRHDETLVRSPETESARESASVAGTAPDRAEVQEPAAPAGATSAAA